jgi:hypothetical protein
MGALLRGVTYGLQHGATLAITATEAGGGRCPRQPGQIRKEAALTIRCRVVRQSLNFLSRAEALRGARLAAGRNAPRARWVRSPQIPLV